MNATSDFDVVIIGGGPAGLQAALVLGRARRRVLLCDNNAPRSAPVVAMHGFLSRDGTDPAELRRIAREQLAAYPSVSLGEHTATAARRTSSRLAVALDDGTETGARTLLLATGVVDELPPIAGLRERWGRSVFNCPYCDGWEFRDQRIAVLGGGLAALRLTLLLTGWTSDLLLCTNGPAELDGNIRQRLAQLGVSIREEMIRRLDGPGTTLERIVFVGGAELARDAAFLHPPVRQHTDLAQQLGCELGEDGLIVVNDVGQTSAASVYAAGDAAHRARQPTGQVLQSAAAGAIAAMVIDVELRNRDLGIDLMALGPAPQPAVSPAAH